MHSPSIIFTLPGLNNSGPEHWQTHWEKRYGFTRIEQKDWDRPLCADWIRTIDETIQKYPMQQVLLVAHSLACSTVVHWAAKYGRAIRGALLVGPSDTEAPSYPPGTTGFKPMPLSRLSFPSIIIASTDDVFVSMQRAKQFATAWGSELVNAGALGHINSASNLGDWDFGYQVLLRFMN